METIGVDRRGDGTALLTMNRPQKLNAMSRRFFAELPELMRTLDADPDVRVGVLTGAGAAFSAGGDIADFHALRGMDDYRHQVKLALEAFLAVERAETPMIAAVNGIAFGGGTEITLACDVACASERAQFAFKEITLGLMPGFGLVRGPEVIGRAWTHRMVLSGDVVDAEQALRIGLVQHVFPADRLLDEALALAARIAAHPPLALRMAKRFVNRHAPAAIAESIEATAFLQASPDTRERVAAFVARRSG
jgi:enoyl-CoA hydratase